ncbi:MAG: hypothetical protein ACRDDP_08655 [Plesiomonas sp.]|uniref:hypothetical protein n=1 Tax=Plesiomonas sp. TaxID=2486279 RepID=UPI003EE5110D
MRQGVPFFVLTLSLLSFPSHALDQTCFTQKYEQFVQASDAWYATLLSKVTQQDPTLKVASEQFLNERKNYFNRNLTAVKWYLNHEPARLALDKSVNEWLSLDEESEKKLSSQSSEFAALNEQVFNDRVVKPNPQSYALRSAFAELLTHPENVREGLESYNRSMEKIEAVHCAK